LDVLVYSSYWYIFFIFFQYFFYFFVFSLFFFFFDFCFVYVGPSKWVTTRLTSIWIAFPDVYLVLYFSCKSYQQMAETLNSHVNFKHHWKIVCKSFRPLMSCCWIYNIKQLWSIS
jgi:hypothetical protein